MSRPTARQRVEAAARVIVRANLAGHTFVRCRAASGWSDLPGSDYRPSGPERFGWWCRSASGEFVFVGRTVEEAEARAEALRRRHAQRGGN